MVATILRVTLYTQHHVDSVQLVFNFDHRLQFTTSEKPKAKNTYKEKYRGREDREGKGEQQVCRNPDCLRVAAPSQGLADGSGDSCMLGVSPELLGWSCLSVCMYVWSPLQEKPPFHCFWNPLFSLSGQVNSFQLFSN